jgi:tRNA (guanine37-N1)-methyltransferase
VSLVVHVLTVFPDLVERSLSEGMVRIARDRGLLDLRPVDIREYTADLHRTTDDAPFGGGAGMVMMVEPIVKAWRGLPAATRGRAVVLSAKGRPFDQGLAAAWSRESALTLVAGRYKGVDERVVEILEAAEVSLGDFVLPGGELAAAVMIEAVARLLPGVLGDAESGAEDSFEDALLGYPSYTRPEDFEGHRVPPVLLSGHHARIAAWRRERRLEATARRRPEFLEHAALTTSDREFLARLRREMPREADPAGDASGQRKRT